MNLLILFYNGAMKCLGLHFKVLITNIFIIIFLITCSSTQLIYPYISKFIKDEVGFFLNLDRDEETLLSQEVSKLINWHRTFMLPKYSDYLDDIANNLEKKHYDVNDINKVIIKGKFLIEQTVKGITPYASNFLMRYQTIEDIEFIEKKMIIRQQERLIKLSKSEDVLYEKRLDRLISNFQRFMGRLSEEQVSLIEEYTSATIGDSKVRLNYSIQRQKVFIEYLKTKPSEVQLISYLNKLLLRGYEITDSNYQNFFGKSLKRFENLLFKLLQKSTISQKEMLIKKLRTYADDFRTISQ